MDNLPGVKVHDDEFLAVFSGNKKVLLFQVNRQMVDPSFERQRNRLGPSQQPLHMHHWQLLIVLLLANGS